MTDEEALASAIDHLAASGARAVDPLYHQRSTELLALVTEKARVLSAQNGGSVGLAFREAILARLAQDPETQGQHGPALARGVRLVSATVSSVPGHGVYVDVRLQAGVV